MKIKFMFLWVFLIALLGCSEENVDYESIYEDHYSSVEYNGSNLEFDLCAN
ncbi:MAG: hypothetical protein K9L74_02535 [Candidatus Izimaplasma sp.]|nr:hypothetical protein [Candidatus Izimaplasma bacterium]